MKKLVLVRHAESGSPGLYERDIDRALTDSGRADARQMAAYLKMENFSFRRICSSPAKRALQTAELFREVLALENDILTVDEDLYLPRIQDFYSAIATTAKDVSAMLLFSHNPGITEFIAELGCHEPVQMPPGGMFGLQTDISDWKDFQAARKTFLFHRYPDRSIG